MTESHASPQSPPPGPTGMDKVVEDLRYAFGFFPLKSLRHVRENSHRLTRRVYSSPDGKGCLFYLLSEPLDQRIDSRATLTQFFTGGSGHPYCELPEYQPARWLVRLIDGTPSARYDNVRHLPWPVVLDHLDRCIAEREACEAESARVERAALGAAAVGV